MKSFICLTGVALALWFGNELAMAQVQSGAPTLGTPIGPGSEPACPDWREQQNQMDAACSSAADRYRLRPDQRGGYMILCMALQKPCGAKSFVPPRP